jgi:hypothetical protein
VSLIYEPVQKLNCGENRSDVAASEGEADAARQLARSADAWKTQKILDLKMSLKAEREKSIEQTETALKVGPSLPFY